MTCKTSVTTKTGVFTVYGEYSSRCEAELKCIKMGQILAPVTNKRDAHKLLKLFKNNNATCEFNDSFFRSYWIGLDITYTKNKQEKVFSNGMQWNERKHSKIYKNFIDVYTDCPVATFDPWDTDAPFSTLLDSEDCKFRNTYYYICLKPRSKISVSNETLTEAIVQLNENNGLLFSVSIFAVSMCAFCIYVAVSAQRKLRKIETEYKVKQHQGSALGKDEIRRDIEEKQLLI